MTPWVTRLLLANGAMFLLTGTFSGAAAQLALVPALILFRPWTVVTYMFLHADLMHLLFNMLGLYFFGPRLEVKLGSRRFMALYLLSGIGGALLSVFTPFAAIVGASGALFGVYYGFAHFWPRDKIFIWGVIPVEARILVIVMTVLALYGGVKGGGGIAHLAHLGGFVGGFLYLRLSERFSPAARFRAKAAGPIGKPSGGDVARWRKIQAEGLHPLNRGEYERLMRKVAEEGIARLTPAERAFLDRLSAA
jgi:membrane associated rhomboid family serine protease